MWVIIMGLFWICMFYDVLNLCFFVLLYGFDNGKFERGLFVVVIELDWFCLVMKFVIYYFFVKKVMMINFVV